MLSLGVGVLSVCPRDDSRLVDSAGGIPVVAASVDQAVGPQTCASVGGGVLALEPAEKTRPAGQAGNPAGKIQQRRSRRSKKKRKKGMSQN